MSPVKRWLYLWLALLAGPAQALQVIGTATDLASGELRYTEHHRCDPSGQACSVEYRDAGGQLFARKRIDYSDSRNAPRLVFQDLRLGQTTRVGEQRDDALVVDAGFDNYVRQHWDDLAGGAVIRFPFLVAGREEPLQMRAQRQQDEACPPQRLCLDVSLDNWLISMLADPIRLQYDLATRRLLQFSGLSNIRDSGGDSLSVRIDYRYPPSQPPTDDLS